MKKTIAVDIDDTLGDYHQTFVAFCNMTYGTQLKKEDFCHSEFEKTWGISRDQMYLRVHAFDQADAKRLIPPRPGAPKLMARIAQYYRVEIITNRPRKIESDTVWWLQQHFPGMVSDIHFCTRDNKVIWCKSEVCKRIGAPILLEDHLHNVRACAARGIHVYLFDQPWNQEELPPLAGAVRRVIDWHDPILETLFP